MGDQIELVRNGGKNREEIATAADFRMQFSRQTTINHEITLGTDQDPYNKQELVNTIKGRELCLFVIFYIFAVFCIVMMFEFFMPVLFNPKYPDEP
ncbi:unnamed protein product [Caenorhabditis bovis]|uniref:Uncharacterized protein n=1 Tax=Caenorhabditis bovis TaxID=2654633 RepID=A0A8S1ES86_9PELO|nr:unnamed protein product [Caenorhabditis bovis]